MRSVQKKKKQSKSTVKANNKLKETTTSKQKNQKEINGNANGTLKENLTYKKKQKRKGPSFNTHCAKNTGNTAKKSKHKLKDKSINVSDLDVDSDTSYNGTINDTLNGTLCGTATENGEAFDFEEDEEDIETVKDTKYKHSLKQHNPKDKAPVWSLIKDKDGYDNNLKLNNKTFPFVEKAPQHKVGDSEPIEIFNLLFTEELFKFVRDSTDNFISTHKTERKRNSVVKDTFMIQKRVTTNEIKVFIGLKLFMSFNNLSFYNGKLKNIFYYGYEL